MFDTGTKTTVSLTSRYRYRFGEGMIQLGSAALAVCALLATAAPLSAQPKSDASCIRLSDPFTAPPHDPHVEYRPAPFPRCWKNNRCIAPAEFGQMLSAYFVSWAARVRRNVEIRFDNETTKQCWIAPVDGPQGDDFVLIPAGTFRVSIDPSPRPAIEMRIRIPPNGLYDPLSNPFEIISATYKPRPIADSTKSPATSTVADESECANWLPFIDSVTIRGFDAATDPLTTTRIPGAALERTLSPGRSVHSALSMIPGMSPTEATGTGGQWTVTGSRRLDTRFSVDGIGANGGISLGSPGIGEGSSESTPIVATTGSTQTLVQAGAVDEITVRTAGVEAPEARSSGAQVAITTRSGTDKPTVTAATRLLLFPAAELGPSNLGVYRPTESAGSGVSGGGPLVPGRAFIFGAFEYEFQNRPYGAEVPLTPEYLSFIQKQKELYDAAPRILVCCDRFGGLYYIVGDYPKVFAKSLGMASYLPHFSPEAEAGVKSLETRRKSWLYTYSLRSDVNFSANHRAFLRFNQGRSDGEAYYGRFSALSQSTERTRMYSVTAGTSSTLGNSLVNELRVNATSHRGYVDSLPEYAAQAQEFVGGRWVGFPDRWVRLDLLPGASMVEGRSADVTQRQLQIVDTTTYQHGRHQWRAGIDATVATAISDPAAYRYTYSFSNLTQLADGRVRQVLSERVHPASVRFLPLALFADHTVAIGRKVEINTGIRVSRTPPPISTNEIKPALLRFAALPTVEELPPGTEPWTTTTNFAPRLGIAYQVRPATVVRAAWALIYDELSRPGASVYGRGYPYVQRAVFTPTSLPAFETLGSDFQVPADSRLLAEYYSFAEGLRPSRTAQLAVGIEQSTRALGQLGITFVSTDARDLVYWSSVAAPGPVPQTIHAYSNTARATYRGLLVEYRRPLTGGLAVSSHYTWSRMRDTESGDTLTPNPPEYLLTPSTDLSTSDLDRPHVLRFETSYELPGSHGFFARWQFAGAAIARSGRPFSVTTTRQLGPSFYDLRADLVPGAQIWISDSAAPGGRRLNRNAFAPGTGSGQGDSARNFLRASPLRQVDVSLARSVVLPSFFGNGAGNGVALRVYVTALNVFNIASYGPPIAHLGEGGFGVPDRSAAQALGTGTLAGSGLSPLEQDGRGRVLQLGLRLGW